MREKIFKKLICYDILTGISQNKGKYGISCLAFVIFSLMFYQEAGNFKNIADLPSIMDCLLYIFKGMKVYVPSPYSKFEIPVIWLTIQLIIAFLVAHYPTNDLFAYGMQILIRVKSRTKWWISKCLWIIITVSLFYLLGFICIVAVAFLFGNFSFEPGVKLNQLLNGMNLKGVNYFELWLAAVFLPVLTSIVVSLIQMFFSFVLSPIYSYVIVVCFSVISAYYYTPFLIGNYSMFLRNGLVYKGGFNSHLALTVDLVVLLFVLGAGCFYFNKCDLLKKK